MVHSIKIIVIFIQCLLSIKCETFVEECAVNEDKFEAKQYPSVPQRRQQRISDITVEIGLYYDIYLRQKFNNNDKEVEKYVKVLMSGVQTVFRYPTMKTKINVVVTRFEMIPHNSVPYVQDLKVYYESFCEWQSWRMQNHSNYDLAILLTSKNLFLDGKGNKNGCVSHICMNLL